MNVSKISVYVFLLAVNILQCNAKSAKNIANVNGVERIVNGVKPTQPYPFVVSIMAHTLFGSYHSCGGSIINERTILTAAHCLAHAQATNLRVHVGETTREVKNAGHLFEVEAIYHHELWKGTTQDYDVGLIRLARSLAYGPTVQPIVLATKKDVIKNGNYATVLGWGYTSQMGPPSDDLLMARVPIVPQSTCKRQMGGMITKRMLCAGFRNGGVDACQMDSGGPLVYNDKLIGIVSWGVGCAQRNKPGVYTRVSEVLPWIEQQLFKHYSEKL